MKRNYFAGLIAIFLLISTASHGQSSRQERNHDGFSSIAFGISGNLYIAFGREYSVVLEGEEKVLQGIITETSGNRLIIKRENRLPTLKNESQVTVRITLPEINELIVSGSGKAEITDPVTGADELEFNVSGSGKIIAGKIEADEFLCDISGSGNIAISGSGSADSGQIKINGSGSYSGEQMEIDHLSANISGSGHCNCKAGDSLKATISGSGSVTYGGDPTIDSRVSGSGKVRSR